MIAVLTGDIIQSKRTEPNQWLPILKQELQRYGDAPKTWEIFRGDSFQCMLQPKDSLFMAILIKAGIKQVSVLDIRIGIGIGDVSYKGERITESNGSAFVNSGTSFDSLKKSTLDVKTPWPDFDKTLKVMLGLATHIMDSWSPSEALVVSWRLKNPTYSQKALAQALHKSQSTISEALKRAGYDEIQLMLDYYHERIGELCQSSS